MFKDLALIFELMFNKRKDYLMLLKYSCPKKKKISIMDVYIQLD